MERACKSVLTELNLHRPYLPHIHELALAPRCQQLAWVLGFHTGCFNCLLYVAYHPILANPRRLEPVHNFKLLPHKVARHLPVHVCQFWW